MIRLSITYSGDCDWIIFNYNYFAIMRHGFTFWSFQFCHHNNNGPARIFTDGHTEWWTKNNLHRLNGPAIDNKKGKKGWYINDIRYNNELEYWIAVQNYDRT